MKKTMSYRLDCEHDVWFSIAPEPGMPVFCRRCDEYRTLPKHDTIRGTYYPLGDFTAFKIRDRIVKGICHKPECNAEVTGLITTVQKFFNYHEGNPCRKPITSDSINVIDLPPNSPAPY